jgi:uncharacterized protein YqjF (DUF2071 family)
MRKFLSAKWSDLIMANYEVEPRVLMERVPGGTELDLHDGRCFVSLVGFMFLDTRVMGIPVPFHINFEEVNLRFYVKRETNDEIRRGVVFVKEIVPRYAIATVARVFYGEPYECWHMTNVRSSSSVEYGWKRGDFSNRISVMRDESLGVPNANSHGEFIIEHYWGYTRRGVNRTDEYKVEHPKWELFSVIDPLIEVDFDKTYGREFAFLSDEKPYSVLLAKGSEIFVYKGERIK